ncbi:class I SAM-dependent methyltransferase [Anthocerotibacter panamensis]|uniref:class I SAM-dependent methyltransferase n=1 Tax=Anthocerotibacter panamensis TaxID=2857077 RepID=UPI001C406FE9|nr:class I SAM-dependent methyltransferase [Anthocerotibacter panamensis]
MGRLHGTRLLRKLWQNANVRAYFEEQIYATDPLLKSPHLRFAPPGHFYSPLADLDEIQAKSDQLYSLPERSAGIDFNTEAQHQLLGQLAVHFTDFDWQQTPVAGRRYWMKNFYFEDGDALILFALIRHLKPQRIIEVGAGFSSALMLDINERYCNPSLELCFIEPHPERLEQLLTPADWERVRILKRPVQDIPLEEFDTLGPNDFLFIDSSHVAKVGSDVNYLVFKVLPRLRSGVVIHFHDVFFPFEYPWEWIKEGRAWNELYLLHAFLQYNQAFEVLLFNRYVAHQFKEAIQALSPLISSNPGASLWLRKK